MLSTSTLRFARGGLLALGLLSVLALLPISALAQTPNVSENVPAESFLGEPFCFQANFSNTGSPGYGPYLRLDLPPERGAGPRPCRATTHCVAPLDMAIQWQCKPRTLGFQFLVIIFAYKRCKTVLCTHQLRALL